MPQRSDTVYRSALADRLALQSLTPQQRPIQSTGEGLANMGSMLAQAWGAKNLRQGVNEDSAARAQELAKALAGGDPAKEAQLSSVASTPEGLQALQGAYAKSLMPEKSPTSVQEYEFAKKDGFQGSYNDFLRVKQQGASEKFGNTPIWGTDKKGNPVLMQPSSAGGVKQVDLPPGVTPQRGGVSKVDLGDKIAIMDANGNFIGFQPKGTAPTQLIDPKENRIISAPGIPGGQPGVPQAAQGGGAAPMAPAQPGLPEAQPSGAPAAPMAAPLPGGPTVTQIPPSREQAAQQTAAVSEADYSIKLVEDLLKHPGMPTVVGAPGATGIPAKLGYPVPGTDAAGFMARLKQIEGKQFLQAFQSLKGGGHITEIEGQKATEAMSRLSQTGQTEEEYKKAADELVGILKLGKTRAQAAAGGQTPQVPPVVPSDAPATPQVPSSAAEHLRKNPRLRDAFDQKYGPGAAASVLGQ